MKPRDKTKELIARQICISNQQIFERISRPQRFIYLTLAENILATVERQAYSVQWAEWGITIRSNDT